MKCPHCKEVLKYMIQYGYGGWFTERLYLDEAGQIVATKSLDEEYTDVGQECPHCEGELEEPEWAEEVDQ